MKLGAAYPSTEVAGDLDAIRTFVSAIDALGYAHVMVPDHVVKAPHDGRDPPLMGPYTEKHSFHDPFVLMAIFATLSDSLGLVTGVLVLPQRQTALVAQQAADIDLLSCERLRLGVGIGWNHVEYAALGQNFRTRGKRIEEQCALLRRLWAEPVVSFEGRFDRIDRAGINPRPRRAIPLWLGGHTEPAYERGARIADGFVFAGDEAMLGALDAMRARLDALGRSREDFGTELLTQFAPDASESTTLLRRWRDAGGTHGTVTSTAKGLGGDIRAHIDYFAAVARGMAQG